MNFLPVCKEFVLKFVIKLQILAVYLFRLLRHMIAALKSVFTNLWRLTL